MSKATDDVLAERQRQIEAEGWTEEHDDQHADGSMALAACCYASMAAAYAEVCTGGWSPEQIDYVRLQPGYNWPRSWSRAWWKPKNPRRDLVRAAALLIAEIERLDRDALKTPNVEVTGAARLHRAASSDRRERGRPPC